MSLPGEVRREVIRHLRAYPLYKARLKMLQDPHCGSGSEEDLLDAQEAVNAVEDVLPYLTDREKKLSEMEFWRPHIENKRQPVYAAALGYSVRHYRRIRNELLAKFAIRMGLCLNDVRNES